MVERIDENSSYTKLLTLIREMYSTNDVISMKCMMDEYEKRYQENITKQKFTTLFYRVIQTLLMDGEIKKKPGKSSEYVLCEQEKKKIGDQIRARQAMLLDFFDKKFWKFNGNEKVEFFTLETFMERVLEKYEIENLTSEEIARIAEDVFKMMEEDYGMIRTIQTETDKGDTVYAINVQRLNDTKNPAEALFCCERD